MIELRAGAATDVGLVRTSNQDELLIANPLFAVADGMGGPAAGEVAAATAIKNLHDAFAATGDPTADHLLEAAQVANRAVWDRAEANPEMRGMGTTLVALALVNDGRVAVINIGDSRLYVLHGGELRQVTSDHNLVAELVAEGRLSKEEAEFHPRRNVITRAIGVDPEVPADLFLVDPAPGDRFLLCSDGLFRELGDTQIGAILAAWTTPRPPPTTWWPRPSSGAAATTSPSSWWTSAKRSRHPRRSRRLTPPRPLTPARTLNQPNPDTLQTTGIPAGGGVPAATDETRGTLPADGDDDSVPGDQARRSRAVRPRRRIVTLGVVLFFVGLLALLALAVAGIAWYSRSSYFVGLTGNRITIFQGRPGGVLWYRPTVAQATSVTTADVESRHLPALVSGQQEPSLGAARLFVNSMVTEKQEALLAARAAAPVLPLPTPRSTPSTTR